MKQRPRIDYTETQNTLMWDCWQKGHSMSATVRDQGRGHSPRQRVCLVRSHKANESSAMNGTA
jgi:hypothetical protein